VYPQEGASRLPLIEYISLEKPLGCAVVMSFACNVMIDGWIWGRKPGGAISNLWAIYTGLQQSTAVYSGLPQYHRPIETYIYYGGLQRLYSGSTAVYCSL
jgi:hypothetical protein